MTDSSTLLLAHGLAPLNSDVGDHARNADTLRARTYTHPAVPGRTVVILTGDAVAPGEDGAMAFLGFPTPQVSEPLSYTRRVGLGYPAWALVNDPSNAEVALGVVKEMGRAARLARSRPGAAQEMYEQVADKLPKAHLPAFWEQAARAMLAADSQRLAAVFFSRARELEDIYSLPVDESARRDAFLEFAFAGALTVKAISAYASQLAKRYEPAEAYREFRELVVRRTRGGLPPWAELPAQMNRLAKAAGLTVKTEETALVAELLAMPATAHAPAKVFATWRATIVALAKKDQEIRARLRTMFPPSVSAQAWLELLDHTGVLDDVAATGKNAPEFDRAQWLTRAIAYGTRGWWRIGSAEIRNSAIVKLLPRVAAALCAEAGEVSINDYRVPAELLDAILAAGIRLAPLRARNQHIVFTAGSPSSALRALAASQEMAGKLDAAIGTVDSLDVIAGIEAMRPAIDHHLTEVIARLDRGLEDAAQATTWLETHTGPLTWATFPGQSARLSAVDLTQATSATLRGGILDEYGCQAWDAVAEQMGAEVEVTYSWPVATLTTRLRAVAVGPAGTVAQHDLRIPPGQGSGQWQAPRALFSGGQFLVLWRDSSAIRGYWSGTPTRIKDGVDWMLFMRSSPGGYQPLNADGLRVSGAGVLRPGDFGDLGSNHIFFDGHTYWRPTAEWRAQLMEEFDPATGRAGRRSLPAFLEELPVPEGFHLDLSECVVMPLPPGTPSPLDAAAGRAMVLAGALEPDDDGVEGSRVLPDATYSRCAGVLAVPGGEPLLIKRPGPGRLQATTAQGHRLWAVTEDSSGFTLPEGRGEWCGAAGTAVVPQLPQWHFLTVRDAAGSAFLRAIPDAVVRQWLRGTAEAVRGQDLTTAQAGNKQLAAVAQLVVKSSGKASRAGGAVGGLRRLFRRGATAGPNAGATGSSGPAEAAASGTGETTGAADTTGHTTAPEGRITDARVARGVAGMLLMALSLDRRLAKLAERAAKDATRPAPVADPVFDAEMLTLVAGDLLGHWGAEETIAAISQVSQYLAGADNGDATARAVASVNNDWTPLIERIGAVALRAVSPAIGPAARAMLADLLDFYADTIMARLATDGSGRLCLSQVVQGTDWVAVHSAKGAAAFVCNGRWIDGDRRYPALEVRTVPGFETVTQLGTVVDSQALTAPWGTPDQLRQVARMARAGTLAWNPQAVEYLATATGLTPQAAAVALTGVVARPYGPDLSGTPDFRAATGLKAAEVKVGMTTLAGFDTGRRMRAIAFGATGLTVPEPSLMAVADAMAVAWVEEFGRAVSLDPDAVTAAGRFRWPGGSTAAEVLTMVAAPSDSAALANTRVPALGRDGVRKGVGMDSVVQEVAMALPWCYSTLPLDHPLVRTAPQALDLLLQRLSAPGLLYLAGSMHLYGDDGAARVERMVAHFPDRYRGSRLDVPAYDDGLTVMVVRAATYSITVEFLVRTSIDPADPRWGVVRGMVTGGEQPSTRLLDLELVRSAGYRALSERIAATAGVAGYDADPLVSAPEVVSQAASQLGISEGGARYYLQLLALAEPTDKNVKAWNGWPAGTLAKARAELVAAGLVVEAKRSRAGRAVFLPGDWWEAAAPLLPIEAWKAPLWGVQRAENRKATFHFPVYVPSRPLGQLFAEAWQRTRADGMPSED